jgi:RNA polymerase sigma factor (sigma-70 family)
MIKEDQDLDVIFKSLGKESPEFIEACRKFILFLLTKFYFDFFTCNYQEDLIHECYIKVYKSLKHFDASKSNLKSFLFTSVRHYISALVRKETKRKAKVKMMDSESYDLENHPDNLPDYVEDELYVVQTLKSLRVITYSDDLIQDIAKGIKISDPITRFLQWQRIQSKFV